MRLFSKIAYHSTKQKGLKKFEDFTSEDKAFTGEGAQIHGWGLYLQEDKEINIERYKNSFDEERKVTVTLIDKKTGDVNSYTNTNQMIGTYATPHFGKTGDFEKFLQFCYHNENVKEARKYAKDTFEHYNFISQVDIKWKTLAEKFKYFLDMLDKYDYKVEEGTQGASQYEVEIPDDFVFLEEDTPIDEQNILMLPSLLDKYKLLSSKISHEIVKHFQNKYPQVNPEIFEDMSINYYDDDYTTVDEVERYLSTQYGYQDWGYRNLVEPKDGKLATFEDFQRADSYISYVIADFLANISIKRYVADGRELYEALYRKLGSNREVSEVLYNYGIDGISYEGGLDGQCYVIFNCKELKITREEE